MAQFVINEWLWADLSGSNGVAKQKETFAFLKRFAGSPHQCVIIANTAFDQKAWALCSSNDPIVLETGKLFVLQVRQNSDRCLILDPTTVEALPVEFAREVKEDDHYLVHAQLGVPGAILVTTDGPLRESVHRHNLPCLSREEFLVKYFGTQQ